MEIINGNKPGVKSMKKKALLYFPLDLNNSETSGISKKCIGIIEAFRTRYDVDVLTDSYGKVYFNGKLLKDFNANKSSLRLYYYNDLVLGQFSLIKDVLQKEKYDIVYFRFHYFLSFGMLQFLKWVKKFNTHAKIYLELPCYPFEKEKGELLVDRLRNKMNGLFIPGLKKLITKIVTLAELPTIWNIPTITISNGYFDPYIHTLIQTIPDRLNEVPDNEFHIAMVARFTIGHAPEILVDSLIEYYKIKREKNVFVHFIGPDLYLQTCKQKTAEHLLKDKIYFHGESNTEQILTILSKVHICVGTLGLHRKNILIDSSLKSREYAFMGMPMILRTKDLDMLPTLFFIKYFPIPESLLDMSEIIQFYSKLKLEHPIISRK